MAVTQIPSGSLAGKTVEPGLLLPNRETEMAYAPVFRRFN
jgi:hypothetical protein